MWSREMWSREMWSGNLLQLVLPMPRLPKYDDTASRMYARIHTHMHARTSRALRQSAALPQAINPNRRLQFQPLHHTHPVLQAEIVTVGAEIVAVQCGVVQCVQCGAAAGGGGEGGRGGRARSDSVSHTQQLARGLVALGTMTRRHRSYLQLD